MRLAGGYHMAQYICEENIFGAKWPGVQKRNQYHINVINNEAAVNVVMCLAMA